METTAMELLISEIKTIMASARAKLARDVNTAMLKTYWEVGQRIVLREQDGELKAQYGKRLLTELSKRLTAEYALGGISNQVYASSYVYYIPNKDELVNEVKALLAQEADEENQL
jgi:hypothetical protein